jgi:hypothetical protein
MLTLQSYTPNYGAENIVPIPTGPHIAPTLSPDGLFSWTSEFSPRGDYVWQVRVADPEGLTDFGTITVHSTQGGLVGDYNFDEVVDAADYLVWRKFIGYVVPACSSADANCNGFVEFNEDEPWRQNFGEPLEFGGSPEIVPEPSSITLFGLAMIGIGFRRRR